MVKKLIENNRRWAAERVAADPEHFQRLVEVRSPRDLWIGCSDSRVPANVIVGVEPGEIFAHHLCSPERGQYCSAQ